MRGISIGLILISLAGCAAPLRTTVAPFRSPASLPHALVGQLTVGVEVLDTPEASSRIFGTDLAAADILLLHLVVENTGREEYEIDAAQIFAMVGDTYFPAFNLTQAAQRVRESSIGTTVAGQAALGALAGAVAGAALGAAIGSATGDPGRGAVIGTAVGSAAGGVSGVAEGTSDRHTNRFRHELAVQDFGDRVIFGGDLHRGFIYFQVQRYTMLRVKVTNITARQTQVVEIPLQVIAREKRDR